MQRVFKHLIIIIPLLVACYFLIFFFSDKTKIVKHIEIEYQPLVYVTVSGKKYHSPDCYYLRSRISKGLREAQRQGYTACSYCYGESYETIEVKRQVSKIVDDTPATRKRSAISALITTPILYLFLWSVLSRTKYFGRTRDHKKEE